MNHGQEVISFLKLSIMDPTIYIPTGLCGSYVSWIFRIDDEPTRVSAMIPSSICFLSTGKSQEVTPT